MNDNRNSGSSSASVSHSQSQSKSRKRKRNLQNDEEINTYLENRYTTLIPGPVLERKRKDLIKHVRSTIKVQFVDAKVCVYGSSGSGTALISSDVDLCVYVKTENPDETITQIANLLDQGGFKDVKERSAKDRLGIFCYHEEAENKTYIDLTLNNKVARRTSKFIRSIVNINHTVKILLVLVKKFTMCFGIDDQKRGTLSSVGFSYMVVLVLQLNNLLPKFSTTEFHDLIIEANAYKVRFVEVSEECGNASTLQLLRAFFHYYNECYDFENDAISIIGGHVVSKQSLGWGGGEQKYALAIVDPFGADNVGRTVSFDGRKQIMISFKNAERILGGTRPQMLFKRVE
ncbi:hypothetical protein OROGR_002966 [Orobanche gracilis]